MPSVVVAEPVWETTEFWLTVLALIGAVASFESKTLTNVHVGVILATAAGVAYVLKDLLQSRAANIVMGIKSPSFWLLIAAMAVVICQAIPSHLSAQVGAQIAGLAALLATYVTSRGLIKGNAIAYLAGRPPT